MPVDLRAEIVVHRPRAAVAEYLLDPVNLAQWRAGVTSVRRAGTGSPAVGSRYLVHTGGRLRGSEHVETVTELDPLERLVLRGDGRPPLQTTTTLAPEHRGSTLVAVHLLGRRGPLDRVSTPLLERALRREVTADLTRLKTILEVART